ncbi:hypothetical protein PG991_013175 [Apiospora marii]|uniref:Uncharacterized protein n=1 Tax=Apiospora marii TaxID=335849 RepID=A0ABR1R5B4_9PEZI
MSAQARPPTAAEFASALQELPASSLALKVLEMRNQIAHLDYSNAEMKPFAEGADGAEPDQICAEGIRENEEIIVKVQQRIELVREEVERRGLSWREFDGKDIGATSSDAHDAPPNAAILSSLAAGSTPAASSSNPEPSTTTDANRTTTTATTNGTNGQSSQDAGADRSLLQQAMDAGIIQRMSAQEFVESVMAEHEANETGAAASDNRNGGTTGHTDGDGGMHL